MNGSTPPPSLSWSGAAAESGKTYSVTSLPWRSCRSGGGRSGRHRPRVRQPKAFDDGPWTQSSRPPTGPLLSRSPSLLEREPTLWRLESRNQGKTSSNPEYRIPLAAICLLYSRAGHQAPARHSDPTEAAHLHPARAWSRGGGIVPGTSALITRWKIAPPRCG